MQQLFDGLRGMLYEQTEAHLPLEADVDVGMGVHIIHYIIIDKGHDS